MKQHQYDDDHNSEGYSDPTVGCALKNIDREQRYRANKVLSLIFLMLDLLGYAPGSNFVIVDKKTKISYNKRR